MYNLEALRALNTLNIVVDAGLDTDFHNWDVPFPAVTMCDFNPVDDELLQEYIER